jgi:Na+/melibiose symporter-like transporter
MILVAILISARGTQKRAVEMYRLTPPPPRFSLLDIPQNIGRAFKSQSFTALFSSLLVLYITTGVQAALGLHMSTFFWGLKPQEIQLVAMAGPVSFVAGVPMAGRLSRIFDKPRVFWAGIMFFFVFTYGPTCLRLIGRFPATGDASLVPLLLASAILAGLCGAAPLTVSAAMIADLTDEFELGNGYRTEGFFFGLNAVTRKASTGLGGAIAGLVIEFTHFPRHATPGAVPQTTLNHLGFVYGPVIGVIGVAGLTIMTAYNLTRTRQTVIAASLQRRRLALTTPAAD